MSATKIYFSNKPFTNSNKGGKVEFKSSDFIYGRLEIPKTLKEFFNLPETTKNNPVDFLDIRLRVFNSKEEQMGWHNSWTYAKVTKEETEQNFWNFDILPEPAVATTLISSVTEFNAGISCAPFYSMFNQQTFPKSDTYRVQVKIAMFGYDPDIPAFPVLLPEDRWINVTEYFTFVFNASDLDKVLKNNDEATSLVKENNRLKEIEKRGLLEEWHMESAPIETGFSVEEMTKMFLANEGPNCKVIKFIVQPMPSGKSRNWQIEKNNLDYPICKYHNQPLGVFCENNGRYFYIEGHLQQAYEGNGYGTTFFRWYRSDELAKKYIDAGLALEAGKREKTSDKKTSNKSTAEPVKKAHVKKGSPKKK
jgi:hypothetical protein